MIQYRTNAGERRKPSLGLFGELTVEQARALAQDWLAEVRRGGDPSGEKADARKAPTVRELCTRSMEDYSKTRNKPSTQSVGEGVLELREDIGPGYRVYPGRHGATLVILLCGGDKRTQDTDIKRAKEYWLDWKRRNT